MSAVVPSFRISATLASLAVVALLLAGCGGSASVESSAKAVSAPSACPPAWRVGWQRLANQIHTPVYCPSWMPSPLDARIGGIYANGRYVDPDRSYLVSF